MSSFRSSMLMSGMASASMAARVVRVHVMHIDMSLCMTKSGRVTQALPYSKGILRGSFTYEHQYGLDLPIIVDRHDLTVISRDRFYSSNSSEAKVSKAHCIFVRQFVKVGLTPQNTGVFIYRS